jgi:hypothetical protein
MAINVVYISENSFTVLTDLTSSLMIGRRVKADCGIDSYKYGTISGSSYSSPNTTVILTAASNDLTPNLVSVEYGIIGKGSDQSMPEHIHDGSEGAGGTIDHGILTGKNDDDHTQYIRVDGSRAFSSTIAGIMPTESAHLVTREYADTLSGTGQTNTASNLGSGEGVYSIKVGADLRFKSLIGGDNITLSADSNEVTISGSAGNGGTSGTSGSSGTSGEDGTSGSSGTSGADGTSGTSGADGTSGSSGTSGADGTSGSSGSSGTSGVGGLSNVVEDTSPSLGGNLNLNEYYIELKPSPISDDAGGGFFSTAIVDTNNVGIGAPLYMNTDGNYDEADADSVDSVDKMIVLALETGTGSKKVLHYGYMRNDGWNWTLVGSPVYISKTQGVLTQIVVSGTGEQIKRVGYATASGTIFFNPSINVGEI